MVGLHDENLTETVQRVSCCGGSPVRPLYRHVDDPVWSLGGNLGPLSEHFWLSGNEIPRCGSNLRVPDGGGKIYQGPANRFVVVAAPLSLVDEVTNATYTSKMCPKDQENLPHLLV